MQENKLTKSHKYAPINCLHILGKRIKSLVCSNKRWYNVCFTSGSYLTKRCHDLGRLWRCFSQHTRRQETLKDNVDSNVQGCVLIQLGWSLPILESSPVILMRKWKQGVLNISSSVRPLVVIRIRALLSSFIPNRWS